MARAAVHYMAADPLLSSDHGSSLAAAAEFRGMVSALHAAGIEVYLQARAGPGPGLQQPSCERAAHAQPVPSLARRCPSLSSLSTADQNVAPGRCRSTSPSLPRAPTSGRPRWACAASTTAPTTAAMG